MNIVDDWIKNLEIGEINFTNELNKITFRVITKILFGNDIDKMNKCLYISPVDGSEHHLNFEDCFLRYIRDEALSYFLSKRRFVYPLDKLINIEPFTTNDKNK